jgi:type IV pilus assembly protein PilV
MHTLKKLSLSISIKRQSGLSLLESLVALVVLALGIMGLAGVQTRLLVETRTANSRAVAVQLIDDLSNRMLLNRYAALGRPQLPTSHPNYQASSYLLASFSDTSGTGVAMPATNPSDCIQTICTPAQLAASDLFLWRTAVNAALPGAQAYVFQLSTAVGDPRQLGIAIGWPLNEKQVKDSVAGSNATKYNAPFDTPVLANGIACPANLICHIVYVQP